jgi:hypothetical protein
MLDHDERAGAGLSRRIAVGFGARSGAPTARKIKPATAEAKRKPQPNGKERLGSGNRVLQSGKCDKRTATRMYGDYGDSA